MPDLRLQLRAILESTAGITLFSGRCATVIHAGKRWDFGRVPARHRAIYGAMDGRPFALHLTPVSVATLESQRSQGIVAAVVRTIPDALMALSAYPF